MADALLNVVLCKARYIELVGTTERLTHYTMCRRNRGRYNQVQLEFVACRDTLNDKTFLNHSPGKDRIKREAIAPVSWQTMKGNLPANRGSKVNQSRM
jgi:hypothetical protein